jgi:hypothetical protein
MHQSFNLLFTIMLLAVSSTYAQKKVLQAQFIDEKINIDGNPHESAWATADIATGFTMFQPDNGKPIDIAKNTEVKLLYDDNAIYIFANMRDDDPTKILTEITRRDQVGTADIFGVFINGFNDGQQDFQFFVTASGVQLDRLATEDGEVTPDAFSQDFSWDAIWDSAVQITDEGWTAEIKIPYAALRFSKEQVQTWGLNFFRGIRRDRQNYTWNPINSAIGAVRPQNGILEGIRNIKPPTRLFLIPYSSYYYENNQEGSEHKVKAGLDIKYGINDSFTLDAILVPDFGQTRFDNVVLNLSPYEQQFTENRPFFTEGTDLFNKAGLLYSRRIGGSPRFRPENYNGTTDSIANVPATVNLLNAIKISGRTKNGLGIGFLNAITETTYATVYSKQEDGSVVARRGIVEPLTNYNVLVLDQRFNQNSSVSFTNTNVARNGNYRDANVSALLFDLNTKENSFNVSGDFKYSHIYADTDYTGFKTSLNIEKTSGKYRFSGFGKYISADYDLNDLGYSTITNYHYVFADFSYRILNPTKWFNTFRTDVKSGLEIQNTTGRIQDFYYTASAEGNSKTNDYYKALIQWTPTELFDFYQPRVAGRYSYVPRNIMGLLYFSSNYNHAFALDIQPQYKISDEKGRQDYSIYLSPRYRFNDRMLLIYTFNYLRQLNDRGYVDHDANGIYYAERNIKTISNELSGRYAINNKMSLNLTARHYWSFSKNHEFFSLNDRGYLDPSTFTGALDENLNLWNFDLSYSWWFAPASQLSILYRNNATDYGNIVDKDFSRNLKNLFTDNLNNIFSISIRYYIDYNEAKRWF